MYYFYKIIFNPSTLAQCYNTTTGLPGTILVGQSAAGGVIETELKSYQK
jgi:hypothetical protein